MTLPELKTQLDTLGLPVGYKQWPVGKAPVLPYVLYYADEDNEFYADDTVYTDGYAVTIEVYTNKKDLNLEKQVKDLLKSNQLMYHSYESFLDTENMFLKAYEIDI